MTVKELREALSKFPDDMEVMTKKTELFGNVAYIFKWHGIDDYNWENETLNG